MAFRQTTRNPEHNLRWEGKPSLECLGRATAAGAAFATRIGQRVLQDLADGASTATALGATAQTSIDRASRLCRVVSFNRRTHVVVGQHIARADDHVASPRCISLGFRCYGYRKPVASMQNKKAWLKRFEAAKNPGISVFFACHRSYKNYNFSKLTDQPALLSFSGG